MADHVNERDDRHKVRARVSTLGATVYRILAEDESKS
jgi:hypothetical protein